MQRLNVGSSALSVASRLDRCSASKLARNRASPRGPVAKTFLTSITKKAHERSTSACSRPAVIARNGTRGPSHCNPRLTRLASLPLPGRPWFEPLLVVAFAASCRHSTGSAPPGACPGGRDETVFGAIVVHRADARPAWVLVPRDGDPRGAVAAVVITGGTSYAATTLSTLVEARLQKSGFPS